MHTPESTEHERFECFVAVVDEGARLDRFLAAHAPWRSRTFFQKRCADQAVLVDGKPARASRRLLIGQHVAVDLGPDERIDRGGDLGELSDYPLSIVYEDEHIAIVDKPAGMVAHPVGGYRKSTLINVLAARYAAPTLVNRLDRHTSGLILVALTDEARPALARLFVNHDRVEKHYIAIVEGEVDPGADSPTGPRATGIWDWPLGPDRGHHVRIRRAVTENGRPARTRYRVLERLRHATCLQLTLLTGRKHQIRVHAAHAGHPIIADRVYGTLRDPTYYADVDPDLFQQQLSALPIQRHALHAWQLSIPHPITSKRINSEAPIPPDFKAALAALK